MLDIFDIQYGSFHDGPGIRTTVFLKGCNLRCFWCHNPESQSIDREIMTFPALCIACGLCEAACSCGCISFSDGHRVYSRDKCLSCGKCAEVCVTGAVSITGARVAEEEILRRVLRDRDFYELSGGGITLSGGEPLLQAEGCTKLLRLAKADGLHTAIETAACLPPGRLERILPYLDHVFCDVKLIDSKRHIEACGADNVYVAENLRLLKEHGVGTTVRVPIVPGFNDSEAEVDSICGFCSDYSNIEQIELIAFHKLGAGKYEALGRPYAAAALEPPSAERMEKLRGLIPPGLR